MLTTTHTEKNKKIAVEWFELLSQGKVEEICRLTAPGWVMNGGLPGLPPGPAGIRKLFESFCNIQQQWKIEEIIAEGDKVVIRATNTCVQEKFLGITAKERQQVFTATFIHYIVDGKVMHTWRNADDLGRVLQIGAHIVPPNHMRKSLL